MSAKIERLNKAVISFEHAGHHFIIDIDKEIITINELIDLTHDALEDAKERLEIGSVQKNLLAMALRRIYC